MFVSGLLSLVLTVRNKLAHLGYSNVCHFFLFNSSNHRTFVFIATTKGPLPLPSSILARVSVIPSLNDRFTICISTFSIQYCLGSYDAHVGSKPATYIPLPLHFHISPPLNISYCAQRSQHYFHHSTYTSCASACQYPLCCCCSGRSCGDTCIIVEWSGHCPVYTSAMPANGRVSH